MSNIIVMNNPYNDQLAVDTVINYCIGNTRFHRKCEYWGGFGLRLNSAEVMVEDMYYMKKYHNQEEGRQLCHFIITTDSFPKNNRKLDQQMIRIKDDAYCDDFAVDVAILFYQQGYQVCFFKHMDTKKPHLHYVINSVNGLNGKKIADVTSLAGLGYQYLRSHYRDLKWQGIKFNDGRDKYSLELG